MKKSSDYVKNNVDKAKIGVIIEAVHKNGTKKGGRNYETDSYL